MQNLSWKEPKLFVVIKSGLIEPDGVYDDPG